MKFDVRTSFQIHPFQTQMCSLRYTKGAVLEISIIHIVLHIGDLTYPNGYLSPWDQFTAQVQPIASTVPYMIASSNHERIDQTLDLSMPVQTLEESVQTLKTIGEKAQSNTNSLKILILSLVIPPMIGMAKKEPLKSLWERERLQKLWQKYKVDIAFYVQVHNYEQPAPFHHIPSIANV
ncbi:unnamed protein product [Arabidopsis thaliana]|uniref:Calcineurin-like phosphoesterase domain-containing protein n=1 Tax=Arabidopsis thaliana TaxID=3702 RepID=A0A5S9XVU3_ARATH|nr:unnamed protein product [Arabidopsis thaliana]